MYSIEQEEQRGNTYGYIDVVKTNAEEVLELTIEDIDDFLDSSDFYVDKENNIVALRRTWQCEKDITEELYRLNDVDTIPLFTDEEITQYIGEIEQELDIQYTDEQKQLFYEVNKNSIVTLTGWAGTGKTFTLNGCLKMIEKKLNNIVLVSPTAKAAKVLERSTGRIASTIHRRLEWFQGEFIHNKENPLYANIIIVDEISMCDIWLFRSLLRAMPDGCKLILVGDPAQLESVATGNVLHDIINSECFPVVRLQIVFRQALQSGILSSATDVRQGIKPYDSESESLELGEGKKDCRLWFGEKTDTAKRIAMIYKSCLKKWSIDDIMTIVPMKKSESGVNNLNTILQEIANPQDGTKNELTLNSRIFREGDRVMHIKNDYNAEWLDENYEPTGLMGIFNGDTGRIKEINVLDRLIYVNYGDKVIEYNSGNFDQLQLSYCITCHKCIADDTWIFTDQGIKQIKELNNNTKVFEDKKLNNYIKVYNGNYIESPVSFYNNGVTDCMKLITKRNYELECTLEHKIDVLNTDGNIITKYTENVQIGDYLLLSKNNNIYGKNINLPNEWNNRSYYDVRTIIYNRPIKLTKEFARFLGYMVADGTVAKTAIKFSKRYIEVTQDFTETIKYLFNYENIKIKLRKSGDYICEICSKDIVNFCNYIDGIQPNNKFVPKCILEAPREYQEEFLKSFFEDGTVNLKKDKFDHIEISMKGELLYKQIQMILLNMGIITTGGYDKIKNQYRLYIYRKDSKIFAERIGFISEFKNDRLQKCFDEYKSSPSNITIPYIINIIRKFIKDNNIGRNKYKIISWALYSDKLTYEKLEQFLNSIKNEYCEDDVFKYLYSFINNYYIEQIKDIIETKKQTYCLEMPETHKFIQNGFYAWNSQGSQSPVVIMGIDISAYMNLKRSLVYTSITRASQQLFIVAERRALSMAIANDALVLKKSFLCDMLKNYKNNIEST
jgi:hypothetical protein